MARRLPRLTWLALTALTALTVLTVAAPLAAAPYLVATRPAAATVVLLDLAGSEPPLELAAGALPAGIAVDAASGSFALADASGGRLRLFVPEAPAAVDATTGAGPAGVAFCGSQLAVAIAQGGALELHSPSTGASLTTTALGPGPLAVACDATRAVVAGFGDDRVWLVDLSTASASAVAVAGFPAGVAIAAGRAWVANLGDDTLSVVDLATAAVVATLPAGAAPRAVAAGGGRVYVADWNAPTVAVFDAASGSALGSWTLAAGPAFDLAYVAPGRLYATHPGGTSVSVLDAASGQRVATLPAPAGLAALGGVVPTRAYGVPAIPTLPPSGLAVLAVALASGALWRLRRARTAGATVATLALLAAPLEAATVVFSDTTFALADWEVASAAVGNGSHQVLQSAGIGNPAPSRWMSHSVAASTGGQESVEVVHRFLGGSFDPALAGAVSAIDAAWDRRMLTADGISSIEERFVVFQGGVAFRTVADTFSSSSWQPVVHATLIAAQLDDGSGAHPDFSAAGAPLSFGYSRRTMSDGTFAGSTSHALDNFVVTVQTASAATVLAMVERQLLLVANGSVDLCARREGDSAGPVAVELRISAGPADPAPPVVLPLNWSDGEVGVRCAPFSVTTAPPVPIVRYRVALANPTPSPGASIDPLRARTLLLYGAEPSLAGPLVLLGLLLADFGRGALGVLLGAAALALVRRRRQASPPPTAAPASEA